MKKVLILVLSSDFPPYDRMIQTSLNTWDSIEVPGTETIFYSSESDKQNTDKIIYLPVDNDLYNVGRKTLLALEWACKYKQFDYIARVNASTYVNKKELAKYVQTLPEKDVFAGLEVKMPNELHRWAWGGGSFVLSKDVIQKVVDNQNLWSHTEMEDVSLSHVINQLGIKYTPGRACSIDKADNHWLCLCYGTESYNFKEFLEIKKDNGQFFFRIKQDGHRELEEMIMHELFKVLR